jgi:hypothetical protein
MPVYSIYKHCIDYDYHIFWAIGQSGLKATGSVFKLNFEKNNRWAAFAL